MQVQQIRGIQQPCDFSGRPGFSAVYGNLTCVPPYQRMTNWDSQPFEGMNYTDHHNPAEAQGQIQSYPEAGYFKAFAVNVTTWASVIQAELIDSGFVDS